MLTRHQVLTELGEMPLRYQNGIIRKLKPYVVSGGYPSDELEVRICLLEEGIVRWYQAEKDYFMYHFLDTFHFNWGDVRDMKDDVIYSRSEDYRDALVEFFGIDDQGASDDPDDETASDGSLDDLYYAMRLIERWLRLSAAEYGDTCPDEFNWAAAQLVQCGPRRCAEGSLIGQLAGSRRKKIQTAQAFILGMLMLDVAMSTQFFLTRLLASALVAGNFFAGYAVMSSVVAVPGHVKYIMALRPRNPER